MYKTDGAKVNTTELDGEVSKNAISEKQAFVGEHAVLLDYPQYAGEIIIA
jgi:hypothetical protein